MPNFISPATVAKWPAWAQRHLVLGLDLQGGSHILLQVDAADVKRQKMDTLRDDVRRVLRDAKVGYTGLAIRGDNVEVRIRDDQDFNLGADQAARTLGSAWRIAGRHRRSARSMSRTRATG